MFVGTQYPIHSDNDYKLLAQLGVNHINGFPPGSADTWTTDVPVSYTHLTLPTIYSV